jgi:oxygen-independent coproporphyrinogen-3 oxidase
MFRATRRELREAGFDAYEFSNFARPGHRAVHNAAYWSLDDVLPLGVSACGYLGGRRIASPRSIDRWRAAIEDGRLAWEIEEPLAGRRRAGELLMCALRREEGASWQWLTERCGGENVRALYTAEIEAGLRAGWIEPGWLAEGLRLTEQGIELSDEFFATLF